MSKPTPGPWEVENSRHPGSNFKQHIRAGKWIVASTRQGFSRTADEVEANARLMAASPELLDVARRLAEWGRGGIHIHDLAGVVCDAVAAIDKATKGDQPEPAPESPLVDALCAVEGEARKLNLKDAADDIANAALHLEEALEGLERD